MALDKTRRKVKLGRFMQALRKNTEPMLRPEDIAPQLRIAATTITRMEGGLTLPGFTLLQALVGMYNASDEDRAEAVRLWEHAKQGSTSVENAVDLPTKYRAFRHDESDAVTERVLALVAVHGLLQTSDYAVAIGDATKRHHRFEGWERRAADERQARQRLLEGASPLRLFAILDESVIRRVIGSPKIMAEQLEYLLTAGARKNITIQVVPFGVGAYGTMSGPVTILEFDDDPALAYLEYAAGGETVENEKDVQALTETFEEVRRKMALSPKESAGLIRAALDGLRNDDRKQDMA